MKAYSSNEDCSYTKDFDEACERLFDDENVKVGSIRNLYVGDVVEQLISNYCPSANNIIEMVAEQAYEECGEWSDDYLDNLPDNVVSDLEKRIKSLMTDWANIHKLQPTFWIVENIKPVKVKLIDDNEYQILGIIQSV